MSVDLESILGYSHGIIAIGEHPADARTNPLVFKKLDFGSSQDAIYGHRSAKVWCRL